MSRGSAVGRFVLIGVMGFVALGAGRRDAVGQTLTGTISAGDNQVAPRMGTTPAGGTAWFAPFRVLVKDAAGLPKPGVDVTFTKGKAPAGMVVTLDPITPDEVIVVTNASGIATLNRMSGNSAKCTSADGPFIVIASVAGGNQLTFDELVEPVRRRK